MPACVVPGCNSGYSRNPDKLHFFSVPTNPNVANLWKDAIKLDVAKGKVVCEKHFKKDEILWQRKFIGPLGQVVGVGQYKIPRLQKGSVPSQFPWTQKVEPVREHRNQVQNVQNRCEVEKVFTTRQELHQETDIVPLQEQNANSVIASNKTAPPPVIMYGRQSPMLIDVASEILIEEKEIGEVFPNIESTARGTFAFEDVLSTKLCLPPGWIKHSTGCRGKRLIMFYTNRIVQVEESYDLFPLKNIIIMENMSIQLKVVGILYGKNDLIVSLCITSMKELQDLLLRVHRLGVCYGVTDSSIFQLNEIYSNLRKDVGNTWRHVDCLLLLFNKKICPHCNTAKANVSRFQRKYMQGEMSIRKQKCLGLIEEKHQLSLLHSRYRSALRAKRLMREKLKALNSEVVEVRDQLRKCSDKDLEEHVRNGNIPENYLHVVAQIMEAVKHKNSKGNNYSDQWMLLCKLLHTRSPSGYDFLRTNNILPLPSTRTIQRYLS